MSHLENFFVVVVVACTWPQIFSPALRSLCTGRNSGREKTWKGGNPGCKKLETGIVLLPKRNRRVVHVISHCSQHGHSTLPFPSSPSSELGQNSLSVTVVSGIMMYTVCSELHDDSFLLFLRLLAAQKLDTKQRWFQPPFYVNWSLARWCCLSKFRYIYNLTFSLYTFLSPHPFLSFIFCQLLLHLYSFPA